MISREGLLYFPIDKERVLTVGLLSIMLIFHTMGAFGASSAGSTSAEFLLMSNGARPAAMADSFTGVADDIHALAYNPAGLGRLTRHEMTFMHSTWLIDTTYEYGAYVMPLSAGAMGFSIAYLDAGNMVGRGNMGQATSDFSASDLAVSIGYGVPVSEQFFIGFAGKFIDQKIDDAQRSGSALDAGLLWEFIPERFYAGVAFQNLGPKLEAFDTEEDSLPTSYRMGVGYYAMEKRLLIASDLKIIIHGKPSLSAGFEYALKNIFFLRSGVSAGSDKDRVLNWTGGVGFTLHDYFFDYTFEPFGELDSTHRFSVVIKF